MNQFLMLLVTVLIREHVLFICLVLVWGHIGQGSRLLLVGLGNYYGVPWIEPTLVMSKASTLLTILSFWSQFVCLFVYMQLLPVHFCIPISKGDNAKDSLQ